MSEAQETQNQQPEDVNANASGDYQTPVEEENRKTGVAEPSNAKPTAVPESGSSDQFTEGAGNQGTEKR